MYGRAVTVKGHSPAFSGRFPFLAPLPPAVPGFAEVVLSTAEESLSNRSGLSRPAATFSQMRLNSTSKSSSRRFSVTARFKVGGAGSCVAAVAAAVEKSNWVLRAAEGHLLPVYEELHRQLVKREVRHADETTLQVLHEPGKRTKSRAICGGTGQAGTAGRPLCSMSTSPAVRRNTRKSFSNHISVHWPTVVLIGFMCIDLPGPLQCCC